MNQNKLNVIAKIIIFLGLLIFITNSATTQSNTRGTGAYISPLYGTFANKSASIEITAGQNDNPDTLKYKSLSKDPLIKNPVVVNILLPNGDSWLVKDVRLLNATEEVTLVEGGILFKGLGAENKGTFYSRVNSDRKKGDITSSESYEEESQKVNHPLSGIYKWDFGIAMISANIEGTKMLIYEYNGGEASSVDEFEVFYRNNRFEAVEDTTAESEYIVSLEGEKLNFTHLSGYNMLPGAKKITNSASFKEKVLFFLGIGESLIIEHPLSGVISVAL